MADDPNIESREQPSRRRRAAALRYDDDHDAVPRMVAKGEGKLADQIIEVARQHGISVYEDPDLIEMLCKLDVNQLIPEKLFVAVAEVMAYVYRVNNDVDKIEKLRSQV